MLVLGRVSHQNGQGKSNGLENGESADLNSRGVDLSSSVDQILQNS